MMRLPAACPLLIAGLLGFGAAAAQPLPDPAAPHLNPGERLEALVERVKAEQGRIVTLEAHFVQRQESALLVEPEEAHGLFSYSAPDRVRWEYLSPRPITVVIRGKEMVTWYRDLGQAERIKIGRYSNQVLKYLGAKGSLEDLLEYFTVTAHFPDGENRHYRLDLTPRYDRVARRLRSMTLWIDPQTFLLHRLRYVDGTGDLTEYRFHGLRVNGKIPEDRFQLALPEGVKLRVVDVLRGSP